MSPCQKIQLSTDLNVADVFSVRDLQYVVYVFFVKRYSKIYLFVRMGGI